MWKIKKLAVAATLIAFSFSVSAQTKSPKRGVGWDEANHRITNAPIEKMLLGVSWLYNWGPAQSGDATNLGTADGMGFAPMCWNGNYDEARIRTYIESHRDGVKYLLGFNEPNFSAQSNMTPAVAAAKWTDVEAIAADYGLTLVAPALNFTGEKVGGRTWSPYEWLDEFIKQYKVRNGKLPRLDCLALHCYMSWYGSCLWFATEYFNKDLYDSTKEAYGQYPNIVELLDDYKASHGHYPRMMLTEFCAWEGAEAGFTLNLENQIDQMTQKIQKLEQSDLVEGYAWFMANAGGGAKESPYMSVFETNTPNSELSTLGVVFVNMSSFDTEKYYTLNERIMAKDYVDATTDDFKVVVRPNTEAGSDIPLQIQLPRNAYPTYLIDVPATGNYNVVVRINTTEEGALMFCVDKDKATAPTLTLPNTNGLWRDYEFEVALPQGKHIVWLCNKGKAPLLLNSWRFVNSTALRLPQSATAHGLAQVYDLSGILVAETEEVESLSLRNGVYIVKQGGIVDRVMKK